MIEEDLPPLQRKFVRDSLQVVERTKSGELDEAQFEKAIDQLAHQLNHDSIAAIDAEFARITIWQRVKGPVIRLAMLVALVVVVWLFRSAGP